MSIKCSNYKPKQKSTAYVNFHLFSPFSNAPSRPILSMAASTSRSSLLLVFSSFRRRAFSLSSAINSVSCSANAFSICSRIIAGLPWLASFFLHLGSVCQCHFQAGGFESVADDVQSYSRSQSPPCQPDPRRQRQFPGSPHNPFCQSLAQQVSGSVWT